MRDRSSVAALIGPRADGFRGERDRGRITRIVPGREIWNLLWREAPGGGCKRRYRDVENLMDLRFATGSGCESEVDLRWQCGLPVRSDDVRTVRCAISVSVVRIDRDGQESVGVRVMRIVGAFVGRTLEVGESSGNGSDIGAPVVLP